MEPGPKANPVLFIITPITDALTLLGPLGDLPGKPRLHPNRLDWDPPPPHLSVWVRTASGRRGRGNSPSLPHQLACSLFVGVTTIEPQTQVLLRSARPSPPGCSAARLPHFVTLPWRLCPSPPSPPSPPPPSLSRLHRGSLIRLPFFSFPLRSLLHTPAGGFSQNISLTISRPGLTTTAQQPERLRVEAGHAQSPRFGFDATELPLGVSCHLIQKGCTPRTSPPLRELPCLGLRVIRWPSPVGPNVCRPFQKRCKVSSPRARGCISWPL